MEILGREDELHRVAVLVGLARNGAGGALLLSGDPGIGKTTVLRSGTADRDGVRVIRFDGYEAEKNMPYAGIQRLITPLSGHLDTLPPRQSNALRVASGDALGPPPDRYLVGLGLLGLLAASGESEPVVCAIDDAHLLDPESLDALAFVGRRLEAESAALLLAGLDAPDFHDRTTGISELRLPGLRPDDALALLRRSLREEIDPAIAMRIVNATGGNPLALVDLAQELTVRQLTETSFGDVPLPVGRHLEQHYLHQIKMLGAEAQLWLLIAAADSTGNLNLITEAGERLGVDENARDAAEEAGMVELAVPVLFRHPLVRSAAYNAATGKERRRVHATLSAVAHEHGLVDLEAWHAAKAVLGTDESVAEQLERAAHAAGERGGSASRARVMAQAANLSEPGPRRSARLISAAEAALDSGSGHLAGELLDDVDESGLEPVAHGRLLTVNASLALFNADPALVRSTAQCLEAAARYHGHDDLLEQITLIRAWEHALPAEHHIEGVSWPELGQRLQAGARLRDGVAGTILEALAALILMPYRDAVPVMRAAVDAYAGLDAADLLQLGSSSIALTTALWDHRARADILQRTADAARDTSSLHLLDTTLWAQSLTEAIGGAPARAVEMCTHVRELRQAMGYDAENVVNVAVLAWGTAPRDQVTAMAEGARDMGLGGVHTSAVACLAAVDVAEGRYAHAYDRLLPFIEKPFFHATPISLPDFIEACVRTGRLDEATLHVDELDERADASSSPWALAVAARSRALISPPKAAEDLFNTAISTSEDAGAAVDTGRAHLVYGEWLRRAKRVTLAIEHLQRAARILDDAGAAPFAERARRELSAAGLRTGPAGGKVASNLTVQELNVARLAAKGHTNAEIGAAMFLSTNTVDYHLRKVFNKLSISSRRQLAERLSA